MCTVYLLVIGCLEIGFQGLINSAVITASECKCHDAGDSDTPKRNYAVFSLREKINPGFLIGKETNSHVRATKMSGQMKLTVPLQARKEKSRLALLSHLRLQTPPFPHSARLRWRIYACLCLEKSVYIEFSRSQQPPLLR